jgi:hypothetical protein
VQQPLYFIQNFIVFRFYKTMKGRVGWFVAIMAASAVLGSRAASIFLDENDLRTAWLAALARPANHRLEGEELPTVQDFGDGQDVADEASEAGQALAGEEEDAQGVNF